jgi:hypothetical protein
MRRRLFLSQAPAPLFFYAVQRFTFLLPDAKFHPTMIHQYKPGKAGDVSPDRCAAGA